MSFSEEFDSWLASVLESEIPNTVVAFSFNLIELTSADAKYGIELIGADEFNANDSDWACSESWVANPRRINIPRAFAGEGWQRCLRDVRLLLMNALSKSSVSATKLKQATAVAIGFVDGDLDLVWQR